jgi:hypothetical protein
LSSALPTSSWVGPVKSQAPKRDAPGQPFAPSSQIFSWLLANPCYTGCNRRIRSEVLACSGYRLLATLPHCVRTVNQYQRSNTSWNKAQSSGLTTPRDLDF